MNCKAFRLLDFQFIITVDVSVNFYGTISRTHGTQIFKPATPYSGFTERQLQCLDLYPTQNHPIPAGKFLFQRESHCGYPAYFIKSNSYANVGQVIYTLDGENAPAYGVINGASLISSPDAPYFQAVPFSTLPPIGSDRAWNMWKSGRNCDVVPQNCQTVISFNSTVYPESSLPLVVAYFDRLNVGTNNAVSFYTNPPGGSGTCTIEIKADPLA
jgi:hypothetical protein